MKTKKLNARASVYANSVEPEDDKSNDACWMAARRGYIAGWKARKEKEKKCQDSGWHVSAIFIDDMIESEPKSLNPEDLEDGEIYTLHLTFLGNKVPFRFLGMTSTNTFRVNYFEFPNMLILSGGMGVNNPVDIIRHATLPEKLKLIEQELRHGYDHSKK